MKFNMPKATPEPSPEQLPLNPELFEQLDTTPEPEPTPAVPEPTPVEDFSNMPRAFFVPANWEIRVSHIDEDGDEIIKGRNNMTGHKFTGTIAYFNQILAQASY